MRCHPSPSPMSACTARPCLAPVASAPAAVAVAPLAAAPPHLERGRASSDQAQRAGVAEGTFKALHHYLAPAPDG